MVKGEVAIFLLSEKKPLEGALARQRKRGFCGQVKAAIHYLWKHFKNEKVAIFCLSKAVERLRGGVAAPRRTSIS
jgi:hypothetical protein